MRVRTSRFSYGWIPICIGILVIICCIFPTYLLNGEKWSFSNKSGTASDEFPKIATVFGLSESPSPTKLSTTIRGIDNAEHDVYHDKSLHKSFHNPNAIIKVAIIVPFIGDALPNWFQMFCISAASSASVYDWIILITDAPYVQTPPNVKLVRMDELEIFKRIATLDDSIISTYTDDDVTGAVNVGLVRKLFTLQPYVIVEIKPCFGFLFKDILGTYSHWAYADIDQLAGRMHHVIPVSTLKSYDIITTSFGDSYRGYMRGQLTIHRNVPFINNLWRSCSHLSHLADRLQEYQKSHYKKWIFVSAEGCYSRVVADHPDVSTFVSASQFSDSFSGHFQEKEGLYLGNALFRCYEEPIMKMAIGLKSGSYRVQTPDSIQSVRNLLLNGTPLNGSPNSDTSKNVNIYRVDTECAYWFPPEFQVCLSLVPPNVDISSASGNYSYALDDKHWATKTCREASTFHFQQWKRNYYTYTARAPLLDVRAIVITEQGFIPLRLNILSGDLGISLRGSSNTDNNNVQLPTFGELDGGGNVSGRIQAGDIAIGAMSRAQAITNVEPNTGHGFTLARLMGNVGNNSISSSTLVVPSLTRETQVGLSKSASAAAQGNKKQLKRDGLATNYCAEFSADLKRCKCLVYGGEIHVTQVSSEHQGEKGMYFTDLDVLLTPVEAEGVTLVSVAWVSEFYDGSLNNMLDAWSGPKLIVLGVMRSSPRGKFYPRADVTVLEVDLNSCRDQDDTTLPDATLFNIGLDAVSTDLVAVFPKGMIPQSTFGTSAQNPATASIAKQLFLAEKLQDTQDLPVALVLPTYVINVEKDVDQEIRRSLHADKQAGSKSVEISRGKEELLAPFPFTNNANIDEGQCGFGQSKKLTYDYFKRSYDIVKYGNSLGNEASAQVFKIIDFSARDFTVQHTMTIPFVFNQTAGPHGNRFVRFPEEVGGHGCFGSTIFRVLAGSGFTLRWAGLHAFAPVIFARDDKISNSGKCYCAHADYFNSVKSKSFIGILNSFFGRAITLRSEGIGNVYAKNVFGHQQIEEQTRLMSKKKKEKRKKSHNGNHENEKSLKLAEHDT